MLAVEGVPFVLFGDENFLKRAEVSVYLHAFKVVHNPDDVESLKHLCVYLDPAVLAEMGAIQNHLYRAGKRLPAILVPEETIPGVKDRNHLFQVIQLYRALQGLSGEETSVRLLYKRVEELLHVKERLLHEKSEEAEEKLANIEALVDCSVSFGTNCRSLLFRPSIHLATRP